MLQRTGADLPRHCWEGNLKCENEVDQHAAVEGQEKKCVQGGRGWEAQQACQRGHCRDNLLAEELALGGQGRQLRPWGSGGRAQ